MSQSQSEYQRYRDAIKVLSKSRSKYDTKKSYSSFWLEDKSDRFSGLGEGIRATNDTAKLIKLGNYQRAIANFVKIVTKRDIPVTFRGDTSFTDGEAVNLTTDIKDNNFDVVVGLALHEGSHIILSDFDLLKQLNEGGMTSDFKGILNWIEDRRIDNYVFTTSPGYRAYYHKMYDYYWNDKIITKALLARKFREVELKNYMFHIVNSLNPAFDASALPGLQEITAIIDTPKIARLKTTTDALEVTQRVWDIIQRELADPANQPKPKKQKDDDGDDEQGSNSQSTKPSDELAESSDKPSSDGKSENEQGESNRNGSGADSGDDDEQEPTNDDGSTAEGDDSADTSDEEEMPELTPTEVRELEKAVKKQNDFLEGKTDKKAATSKKMVSQIKSLLKGGVEMQAINVNDKIMNMLIYDYSAKPYGLNYASMLEKYNDAYNNDTTSLETKRAMYAELTDYKHEFGILDCFSRRGNEEAVAKGLELGGLLGRKLQVRGETRTLEHNRLNSGRIDNKRLAHAGYGVENIFNQLHVDKYKRANLHICLDASGSMGGSKWDNAMLMTAAICKAATYVQNVSVQVTLRGTTSESRTEHPALVNLYDSRKNSLNHIITLLKSVNTFGCTPEGICYDGMMRKNMLVKGSSEVDSYFLNISDGEPAMNGFGGRAAVEYTRRQVEKMRNTLDMSIMSFFASEHSWDLSPDSSSNRNFRLMYGKDAAFIKADNMTELARVMNSKFLSHGKVSL